MPACLIDKTSLPPVSINPFTPESCRTLFPWSKSKRSPKLAWGNWRRGRQSRTWLPAKESVPQNTNMASCFEKEFWEVEEIGVEEFGTVYKCIMRLDGCNYSIKHSTKTLPGLSNQNLDLHKVNVHVVISHYPHMVLFFLCRRWSRDQSKWIN